MRCGWHRDLEDRAAAIAIPGDRVPALQFNQMPHDGEAKSGAARVARARSVHAIKAFEDAREIGFRNPRPAVGEGDSDLVAGAFGANVDPSGL